MGIPLGIVRDIPAFITANRADRVWPTIAAASWACAAICVSLAAASVAVAVALGTGPAIAILAAIWWISYAAAYYCAQCLAALGAREAGSFFYFSAPPIALLLSLAPYLLLAEQPSVMGILLAAVAGAVPVALWSAVAAVRMLRRGNWPRGPLDRSVLWPMITFGFTNTISAFALTAIYWIPTWLAGLTLGAAAASILGLASRLNNVAVALMGAIRFVARPQIVAAATLGRWGDIERNARLVSTLTTVNALLCLGLFLVFGRWLIELVFGAQYSDAYIVLLVLLLGNVAEATGSVVDEILKMTGAARFVLVLLLIVVAGEVALGWFLQDSLGMVGLAWAQTIAVILLYVFQIAHARISRGVLIVPFLTPRHAIQAFRRRGEHAAGNPSGTRQLDDTTTGTME